MTAHNNSGPNYYGLFCSYIEIMEESWYIFLILKDKVGEIL